MKWGCLGALAGGLVGCAVGGAMFLKEMRPGAEPGWLLGPLGIAGAIGGLILGLLARLVAWLVGRLRQPRHTRGANLP